jgi:hypothetical protein
MALKGKIYCWWKYFAERKLRAHYQKHYENELKQFETDKDKKPSRLMKQEMRALKRYWGCYPFQYIRYGMYKASCTLSIEEMKDYIPNFFAYYLFFPKHFKDYGIISDDKEMTYRVLDSGGMNQPVLLLQYKNGLFYDSKKNVLNQDQVQATINESKAKKLFLKPTKGLGGRGILVFSNKSGRFMDEEGHELSFDFINTGFSNKEDYILQEGLEQHEALNKIYPNAVNTFRVMTEMKNGNVKMLFGMLRMGQGGSHLDNASQTGLVCKINVDTGAFDQIIHQGHGRTIDKHPDSNFSFKAYHFPHWPEIKTFVTQIAHKFDAITYVGWDVAYTTSGPALIELNAAPGLEYLQDCHGGVRKAYGIDNPRKFWYNDQFTIKD